MVSSGSYFILLLCSLGLVSFFLADKFIVDILQIVSKLDNGQNSVVIIGRGGVALDKRVVHQLEHLQVILEAL